MAHGIIQVVSKHTYIKTVTNCRHFHKLHSMCKLTDYIVQGSDI